MTTLVVVIALETRIREGIADFGSVYCYIANIYCNNTIWRPPYHDNTIYDFHITILRLVGHIYHIILFILCSTLDWSFPPVYCSLH
jgi:hypothetical protein